MKIATKLILGLAQLADFTSDFVDLFDRHNQLMYGYTKNKTRLRDQLTSLLSVGFIDKKVKGGKIFYRVTSQGFSNLYIDLPVYRFSSVRWDKLWRIVIYDIPEEYRIMRQKLQYKLKSLSFGQWQKSVWVTPHPIIPYIREFLISNKMEDYCQVYEARNLYGDSKELANNIWKLEELNFKYKELFVKIKKIKEDKEIKKVLKDFELLLFSDPGLPQELLPKIWYGSWVQKEIFKKFK